MNPQQYPPPQPQWTPQAPQPGQPGHNPYGFFMDQQQPKGRRNLGGPMKWLFILGAIAAVVVLIVVILSVIRGGGPDKTVYVKLVQQQQEIARVAGLQGESLRQQNVKNFVLNTQLTITSDQVRLQAYLQKAGIKISAKEIVQLTNQDTDAQLKNAASSNTVDTVMVSELQKDLITYQSTLAGAYKSTSSKTTKALLVDLNNNAKLLQQQSKQ